MDDLEALEFDVPNAWSLIEREEDVLVDELMNAIDAPVEYDIDHLTTLIELLGNRQQLRALLSNYVDNITACPYWSYERIRTELQAFADACNPPITHMQARTLAFIEKRKRAKKGDMAAHASLLRHQRRRWRLASEVEDHLWTWITDRWAVRESPVAKHQNLVLELNTLSVTLNTPVETIRTWVRAVLVSIVKMARGGVKIKGIPARAVVRAAIDDTAP